MRWATLMWVVAGPVIGSATTAAGPEPRAVLFIVLDAVPYATALEASAGSDSGQPLFAGFQGPVPLVSSFPSTTGIAFAEIFADFGLERSPGYVSRFFDWDQHEKVGGGPISYYRYRFPWRHFFDWKRQGVLRASFKSLRPVRASLGALRRALDEFVHSESPTFFVYVAATDAAAHLRGPDELEAIFVELDQLLEETRARRPDRPFDTVILSDHGIDGGDPLDNVHPEVKAALESAGFSIGERLSRPGNVVMTPYGLVSSFEVYTFDGEETRVAAATASVPGVDLCAYATDEGWSVVGEGGSGHIRRRTGRSGTEWSYAVEGEDPLELVELFAARETGGDGWMPDGELFRATADDKYPDPFHRLTAAFDLVENPASVVCSLAPGHMYGMRKTELAARIAKGKLRWTHGALYREASLGFLMTDSAGWRPNSPVRAGRALEAFAAQPRGTRP